MKTVRINTTISHNNLKPSNEFRLREDVANWLISEINSGSKKGKLLALEHLLSNDAIDFRAVEVKEEVYP